MEYGLGTKIILFNCVYGSFINAVVCGDDVT